MRFFVLPIFDGVRRHPPLKILDAHPLWHHRKWAKQQISSFIDLFKLSLSDIIRSVQIEIHQNWSSMEVELCAASYFLRGLNNHKLRWTSLTTRASFITLPVNRIFCDFPVDVSRWCASVTSARCVSLIGYFGHFKSKLNFFCWILSRCPT